MLATVLAVWICGSLAITGATNCADEDPMWDRFRLWFFALDHNGDQIVSNDDFADCVRVRSAGVTDNSTLASINAKCTEILPRWLKYFVLRLRSSANEDQFIQSFCELRNKNQQQFENVIIRGSRIAFVIFDMNNDEFISPDEDLCVTFPVSRTVVADAFANYLLGGGDVGGDPACPWIFWRDEAF